MPINYKNYHPQWPLIRAIISHRDHNRCKRCKAPHLVMIWRFHNRTWQKFERPRPKEGVPEYVRVNASTPPHRNVSGPLGARAAILCVCSVAHLDWDRTNNSPSNLAMLCQQCHLDHDRPQHLYRTLRSKLSRAAQYELFPVGKPIPDEI